MRLSKRQTDDVILAELAQRLTRRRIDCGMTQAQLAQESGVSKSTVERLESGASVQLSSLIRLFRTLDLLEGFESLLPATGLSPIELLKLRGKSRQRAYVARTSKVNSGTWTWGDEQ